MKKSVRKITINEQKWTWVVESLNYCTIKEVRIYSPEKKMFRLKPEDISTMKTYEEYAGDTYHIIQPHMVRDYIETKLINSY